MSAEPIHSSDYVKVGVLDAWIRQPCDSSPAEDSSGIPIYRERWKGPYADITDMLDYIYFGADIEQVHDNLNNYKQQIDTPDCPDRFGYTDGVWRVQDFNVEECEAGDHCFLNITYKANYGTYDVQTLTENDEQDVWSLTWQSYSVSPWDFCSNEGDAVSAVWNPSYDSQPPAVDWSKKANRANIQKALDMNPEFKTFGDGEQRKEFILFTPDKNVPDYRLYLQGAEVELYKKIALGRNAIFHYPVLIHQTQKIGNYTADYDDGVGSGVDEVSASLPQDCPYNISEDDWSWLKIGDEMTQVKTKRGQKTTYTRKETFQGVLKDKWDKNFYATEVANSHSKTDIQTKRWTLNWL